LLQFHRTISAVMGAVSAGDLTSRINGKVYPPGYRWFREAGRAGIILLRARYDKMVRRRVLATRTAVTTGGGWSAGGRNQRNRSHRY
jgi:hypothetical protein